MRVAPHASSTKCRPIILIAIPTYLLAVTPAVDFPEIIRRVPGALLGLVSEGEGTP
jgi:hypothetical protein